MAVNQFSPGSRMNHDWIFEVLTDLQAYAEKNGLPATAASAAEALAVARSEIAALTDEAGDTAEPQDRRRH
jgi:hypothetical protein